MQISRVTAHRLRIPFRRSFGHAIQHREATDTIVVIVESDDGESGIGEVLPRPYLTGETVDGAWTTDLPECVHRWTGKTWSSYDAVVASLRSDVTCVGRRLATFSGWELAVLDLAGKTFDCSAAHAIGQERGSNPAAGDVIDFSIETEDLEKKCLLLRLAGCRHLKVKVGLNDDFQRLSIVSRALGEDLPIRLDANGAWTADEAVTKLRRMRGMRIASIEQPTRAADLPGMRKVRELTGVAVVADESLCSIKDAEDIIKARAADAFNIRLGKCGGVLASYDLVKVARDAGLGYHLGTLVGETGILSKAAELFGARVAGFEFLEGKQQNTRLLAQDIVEPTITTTPAPGLGLALIPEKLAHFTTLPPRLFQQ